MLRRPAQHIMGAAVACLFLIESAAFGQPSRPPQTGFYCLDVASGQPADVRRVLDTMARSLRLRLSVGAFETEEGETQFLAYGRGLSVLVGTSIAGTRPDAHGRPIVMYNRSRYDVHAFRTGPGQDLSFEQVLETLASEARSAGMGWSPAPEGRSCSE